MLRTVVAMTLFLAAGAVQPKDDVDARLAMVGDQLHSVTSLEARVRANLEKRVANANKKGKFVVLTDDMVHKAMKAMQAEEGNNPEEDKVKSLQAGVDGVNQNCEAYPDVVTPWMHKNEKKCDTWPWLKKAGKDKRCNNDTQEGDASWILNKYCWKTCCELGVGYSPEEVQEKQEEAATATCEDGCCSPATQVYGNDCCGSASCYCDDLCESIADCCYDCKSSGLSIGCTTCPTDNTYGPTCTA